MKKKLKIKKIINFDIKIIHILTGLVFLVALGLLMWFFWIWTGRDLSVHDLSVQDEAGNYQDCEFRRWLDGVCVDSEEEMNPSLVAVMIENHTEARPQSGLVDASIVYEAPVEANYTRFLAIYLADVEVEKVGPVRSARPYYLDWLAEYGDPMYMHVGGSPVALDLIKQYDIFDLNEFYRGWYYWRSTDRYAPHNVYTSSELWNSALEDYESQQPTADSQTEGWVFCTSAEQQSSTTTLANEIIVSFLSPVYEATWEFNSSTGKYDRYQMEGSHRDQDGRKIKADTIIVQHVNSQVLDSVGRLNIDTIGEGEVEVFYDGLVFEGTWKKVSRTSRTKFYNENGEEIKLKAGKIWIEVVNGRGSVKF